MPTDFLPASKDVRRLVKEIRAKFYEKFKKAKIVIVMRSGKWNKWGTMQCVSKKMRRCGIDGDYILTLNGDAWTEITTKQKTALVDHELRHMKRKKTKTGVSFKLVDHDVEEFIDIVKKYGDWTPNLKALHEVMSRK